jgi:uncharacterized protein YcfL
MKLPRLIGALLAAVLLVACSSKQQAPPAEATQIPVPTLQLGIDIDFYSSPGANIAAIARQDIAYIKSLHANAVSISFPFYNDKAGSAVGPLTTTPSVTSLDTLITTADAAGLAVTLRPVLSEAALGEARVHWRPAHLVAWFTAYQHFVLPYAALAQRDQVDVFVVGTELNKFSNSPEWATLSTAIAAVYHGQLAFSNNWLGVRNATPGLIEMTDAYAPAPLSDGASVSALAGTLAYGERKLPTGSVLSEVGIAAQSGAYAHPWKVGSRTASIKPQIQVNWFNAQCQAVAMDHLGGIYFWPLYFGQSLTFPDKSDGPTAWAATLGATAIANCFTSLRASS